MRTGTTHFGLGLTKFAKWTKIVWATDIEVKRKLTLDTRYEGGTTFPLRPSRS